MMTESDLTSPTSTTPSCSDVTASSKMDDKISYRKSNKPMMEKKRRARINSCLTQLKSLVLQAMKKDNSQYSKLEKADILELTVKHLKSVQRLHSGLANSHVPDAMTKYRAGFNECANEVMRYLGETQEVNCDARTRILSHLSTILTPINSLSLQPTHTPILPAPAVSSSSSASASSHVQMQQQQQQAQFVQRVLQSQSHQQEQQQQQQQQLHPNQQHSLLAHAVEAIALAQDRTASNALPVNKNNNIVPNACHVAGNGYPSQVDFNQVISPSPTAFQSPVLNPAANSGTSGGLQLPCIATTPAAMATATPLQFVHSTLPGGQVAFVLTPQSIPAMGLYTPPVIASSQTVSSDFARSVLEQQQLQQLQQQQQQQQQHRIRQEEQRQLAISGNIVTSGMPDGPIALVSKPDKLTSKTGQHSSSPFILERSRTSVSPTSASPSASPPSSITQLSSSSPSSNVLPNDDNKNNKRPSSHDDNNNNSKRTFSHDKHKAGNQSPPVNQNLRSSPFLDSRHVKMEGLDCSTSSSGVSISSHGGVSISSQGGVSDSSHSGVSNRSHCGISSSSHNADGNMCTLQNMENLKRGEEGMVVDSDTHRTQTIGNSRVLNLEPAHRGTSVHHHQHQRYRLENIENAADRKSAIFDSPRDQLRKPDPEGGVVRRSKNAVGDSVRESAVSRSQDWEATEMRRRADVDDNDDDSGVIDYRTRRCGSEVRVKSRTFAWRPW